MDASRMARPAVIVAAGWFALCVYAYPGRMTAQAVDMLRQARTKFFEPANPPGMSGLWRWLEVFVAGPTPMFVVQSTALAVGAYLLLRRVLPELRAGWLTAALLVFPPVLAPMAAIASSSLMSGLLVLGAAALLEESARARVGGLVALFVATLVEPHAFVATLPIVVLLFGQHIERLRHALIAWVIITGAAFGATLHYTKKPTPLWSYVEPAVNRHWDPVPVAALPADALRMGLSTRTTGIQDGWTDALSGIADHTPLFSPWLFFGLAVLVIPFALRRRDALAIAISGIGFQLTYRDSVWPAVAACLATALVVSDPRGRR